MSSRIGARERIVSRDRNLLSATGLGPAGLRAWMANVKYMQTLEAKVFSELRRLAKERGVNVQELVRAVIIPDWMRDERRKHARR